jgi:hypothetical protein
MEGTNIPQPTRTLTARQENPPATGPSLAQAVVNAIWPWLHSRRAMVILAAVVMTIGGLALGWNWLVAVGVAPILIAVLPCVVMCAVGLCAMKQGNKSCSASNGGEMRPNASASADSSQRVAIEPGDMGDVQADALEPGPKQTDGVASPLNSKREENS